MEKKINDKFMQQVLKKEAWKYLSENLKWTESLLEKYAEKVDWKEISYNDNIYWTIPMLKKFSRKLDWSVLSNHADRMWFTYEHLETFKDRWDWNEIVFKFALSDAMIKKYADYIDWTALIGVEGSYHCFMPHNDDFDAIAFFEKYKEYIPMAKLQKSDLWKRMVRQTAKQLFTEIMS